MLRINIHSRPIIDIRTYVTILYVVISYTYLLIFFMLLEYSTMQMLQYYFGNSKIN